MELTQLANLGEFIGGVAVLVTLLYLAVQVRQSQILARAESETKSTDLWVMHCLQPALYPGLARIIEVGLEAPEQLDEEEYRRLRWWMMHYYFMVEGMWRKWQQGLISDQTWEGHERTIAGMWRTSPAADLWEKDPVTHSYSSEFREYVFGLKSSEIGKSWGVPGAGLASTRTKDDAV
jgi:hypothetical protein